MNKEFIPYEQALELKELGFDEPCFMQYGKSGLIQNLYGSYRNSYFNYDDQVTAPIFSQAFRWLYQKLGIEKGVMPLDTESQQLLLKELIDKVSSKHSLV